MSLNFSIVLIARQEEKTLPRLLKSLEEFKKRGGETIIVDTGSTDKTTQIARDWGCKVTEVGEKFVRIITDELADKINKQFVIDGENPVVKAGDKLFDYSSARNFASSLATNQWIFCPDADEEVTVFNLDEIEKIITEPNIDRLIYDFVFSHQPDGSPAVAFAHSKFFRRDKYAWRKIVHEILYPLVPDTKPEKYVPPTILKLEHWQQPSAHRSRYLTGLALDVFENPTDDRAAHYFAREMGWNGRPKSAIKEFTRHIAMQKWPTEASQSMVFIGDCYQRLGLELEAVQAWHQAYVMESGRREPLIKLAEYYYRKGDARRVIVYCKALLEIPPGNFYANNSAHYTYYPHELLYWAYWQIGDKAASATHFWQAFHRQSLHSKYLHDIRFYQKLPTIDFIIPTLGRPEGLQACRDSIARLNYPMELINVVVLDGEGTVPEKVKKGVEQTTGDYICYGANDMTFEPDSIILAVLKSQKEDKALVSFNEGPLLSDNGNINTHFIIRRDFLPQLERREIFSTDMHHVGVDNWLWAQADKLEQAVWCSEAKVVHNHFSKGAGFDKIYELGWSKADKDRDVLKEKLAKLHANT